MAERDYSDVVSLAADFVKGEIAEAVKEGDRYPDAPFREHLYAKAEEVGLLSFLLPEDAGGAGETVGALAEVLYEIARTDASVAAAILCQAFAHRLLMGAGKEALASEAGLISAAIYDDPMELAAGVNASGTNGSYRLKGALDYAVLAPVARSFILPASLNGETSLFLIKRGKGVRVEEPLLTLGLRACPVADLKLDDAEGTLLVAGDGARTLYLEAVDDMRAAVAAMSAGVIAGCFEEAGAYAPERYQGGKQIIEHSQVRAELGRIAVNMLASRQLYRGIFRDSAKRVDSTTAAAVQMICGEAAAESSILGVQILGGNGYMEDYGQEKRMRDAKQIQGIFGRKDLILQDITDALV